MIELMIIVAIIGVMAAMAAPNWFAAMPRMRTQAAVRDVVSTLREARSLAIARKEPCGVFFDETNNQFVLFLDRNSPELVQFAPADSAMDTTHVGTDAEIFSQTFPSGAVTFQPDGAASANGRVYLRSSDLNTTYTVDILGSTGRIRMVEGYLTGG